LLRRQLRLPLGVGLLDFELHWVRSDRVTGIDGY
jgi:hypothetical protein